MIVTRRTALLAAPGLLLAPAASAPDDVTTLNRLLRLERRLEAFYDSALRRRLLPAATARLLRDQEREHAAGLEKALRGLGARPPAATEPAPLVPSEGDVASLARRLEREATSAYVDAIAGLRRTGLLVPLGSIAACEAQHEIALADVIGQAPERAVR